MNTRRIIVTTGFAMTVLLGACSSPEPTAAPESTVVNTTMEKLPTPQSAKPNPTLGAASEHGTNTFGDSNPPQVKPAAQPEPSASTSSGAPELSFGDSSSADDNSSNREHRNALIKAESYLSTMPFSASGLRKQLEYEQFPATAIDYAMANITVDWNQQAVLKARSYDSTGLGLSDDGLVDQLIYEGFTPAQARYGVDNM
ncbi:Ltp family lipoprotein [Corynebacterium auriscanis]|uniref:Ltp family lipoprotein n=1 Tax=Corynebacterium auriscanis TaxID=99807 RepID=UPI00068B1912|nr:Ltp family lipoprotein [Corynebacterium auriscanis]WJY73289.1 Host cell surface-exposed lipoprotein [Corynebacterium auriscanis]